MYTYLHTYIYIYIHVSECSIHVLACVGVSASVLPTWTAPCPAPVQTPSLPQFLSLNQIGTL